jgi:hypothetical protein
MLVAEIVGGELARALGLPVPELVLVEVDPAIGRSEPDAEIQDLLLASEGVNLGLDYLPGSLPYSPAGGTQPDADLAADVVWLDALVTNIDRTANNPNLLTWHGRVWLIDHGAALYWHHAAARPPDPRSPFAPIRDHVLLPLASSIAAAHERLSRRLTRPLLEEIAGAVPADWLGEDNPDVYVAYLADRLEDASFVAEAERARG